MRSVPSRLRLRSQAAIVPDRLAFDGITLLTRNTPSRRPATTSRVTSSAPPLPYISAVSMSVMPRSRPSCSARTSSDCERATSPIRQVPCPSAGTVSPEGRRTCPIGILEVALETDLEGGNLHFDTGARIGMTDQLAGVHVVDVGIAVRRQQGFVTAFEEGAEVIVDGEAQPGIGRVHLRPAELVEEADRAQEMRIGIGSLDGEAGLGARLEGPRPVLEDRLDADEYFRQLDAEIAHRRLGEI